MKKKNIANQFSAAFSASRNMVLCITAAFNIILPECVFCACSGACGRSGALQEKKACDTERLI